LVVHLDAEELLAEKTRAILMRSKGRDYFDFWYLLSKGLPLRVDYIREKMKWYGKDYRQGDLTEIIATAKEKDLYNDLARFLPKHYRQTITDLKKTSSKNSGHRE
jgi:predicted nucleotidyltransferase component of viral defense system